MEGESKPETASKNPQLKAKVQKLLPVMQVIDKLKSIPNEKARVQQIRKMLKSIQEKHEQALKEASFQSDYGTGISEELDYVVRRGLLGLLTDNSETQKRFAELVKETLNAFSFLPNEPLVTFIIKQGSFENTFNNTEKRAFLFGQFLLFQEILKRENLSKENLSFDIVVDKMVGILLARSVHFSECFQYAADVLKRIPETPLKKQLQKIVSGTSERLAKTIKDMKNKEQQEGSSKGKNADKKKKKNKKGVKSSSFPDHHFIYLLGVLSELSEASGIKFQFGKIFLGMMEKPKSFEAILSSLSAKGKVEPPGTTLEICGTLVKLNKENLGGFIRVLSGLFEKSLAHGGDWEENAENSEKNLKKRTKEEKEETHSDPFSKSRRPYTTIVLFHLVNKLFELVPLSQLSSSFPETFFKSFCEVFLRAFGCKNKPVVASCKLLDKALAEAFRKSDSESIKTVHVFLSSFQTLFIETQESKTQITNRSLSIQSTLYTKQWDDQNTVFTHLNQTIAKLDGILSQKAKKSIRERWRQAEPLLAIIQQSVCHCPNINSKFKPSIEAVFRSLSHWDELCALEEDGVQMEEEQEEKTKTVKKIGRERFVSCLASLAGWSLEKSNAKGEKGLDENSQHFFLWMVTHNCKEIEEETKEEVKAAYEMVKDQKKMRKGLEFSLALLLESTLTLEDSDYFLDLYSDLKEAIMLAMESGSKQAKGKKNSKKEEYDIIVEIIISALTRAKCFMRTTANAFFKACVDDFSEYGLECILSAIVKPPKEYFEESTMKNEEEAEAESEEGESSSSSDGLEPEEEAENGEAANDDEKEEEMEVEMPHQEDKMEEEVQREKSPGNSEKKSKGKLSVSVPSGKKEGKESLDLSNGKKKKSIEKNEGELQKAHSVPTTPNKKKQASRLESQMEEETQGAYGEEAVSQETFNTPKKQSLSKSQGVSEANSQQRKPSQEEAKSKRNSAKKIEA